MSSLVGKWEKDVIKRKHKILRTKQIRFFPTLDQQKTLVKWLGTARYTYNQTIHKIKNEKQSINFYILRNRIVPKKKISNKNKWILDTPKDIRASAVKEVVMAYKSGFTNLKNKNIKTFKINFRSKKNN
tara:strand:- start:81 stop:467 length:387 start_codon:yes stop_codon:yes gene_type:complete